MGVGRWTAGSKKRDRRNVACPPPLGGLLENGIYIKGEGSRQICPHSFSSILTFCTSTNHQCPWLKYIMQKNFIRQNAIFWKMFAKCVFSCIFSFQNMFAKIYYSFLENVRQNAFLILLIQFKFSIASRANNPNWLIKALSPFLTPPINLRQFLKFRLENDARAGF